MAMICAPKRKAVGSNPAGEAKKALYQGFFYIRASSFYHICTTY